MQPTFPDLQGASVFITGGGSGIGAATCVELGASGAVVIVADRDMAGAEKVVAQITGAGGKAHAVAVDVADAASVEAMVRLAVDRTEAFTGWSTMPASVARSRPRPTMIWRPGNR